MNEAYPNEEVIYQAHWGIEDKADRGLIETTMYIISHKHSFNQALKQTSPH